MKRKLIAVAAIASAVSLTIAGCSSSPAASTGSADSGTLTIAAAASAKPDLDPIIAKFKDAHPGLTITANYADNQQYQATLRTQLSAGTAPDVFYAWPGNGNPAAMQVLAPAGYLKDLSSVDGLPKLPEALNSVTHIHGKEYVFPLTVAGIGAIYNEQAVKDIGATVPTTWPEVLQFCADAKKSGKVAFSMGLQTLWVTQLIDYTLVPTLVYSQHRDFEQQVAAGKASFADSGWKDAMTKFMSMNDNGCFNKNPLGTSVDVANKLIATGDALATVTLTTSGAAIKALAPSGTTFGMFALPATDNADDTWMPAAAFDGFAINAKAKNMEAAVEFFKFLTSPESITAYAKVAGSLPSVSSGNEELDSSLKVLDGYWQAGKTYPFPDQLWPNPMVSSAHKEGIQKIFGGQASIDDVLKEMDAGYKAK